MPAQARFAIPAGIDAGVAGMAQYPALSQFAVMATALVALDNGFAARGWIGSLAGHQPAPQCGMVAGAKRKGSMHEETYDTGRARNLEELLRALAKRILELDRSGGLLPHAGELTRITGDVRSELFHYEVRATYDTPEVAESRRIVAEASRKEETETWHHREWSPDEEE